MSKKSASKAVGELNGEAEKPLLATPSTNAEPPSSTSDMSGNTPGQTSPIGFLPTAPLEIENETANAMLVTAFAAKLGALVVWKKIKFSDGREALALCFPLDRWQINDKGELEARKE